jgi:hypothetical protein
MNHRKKLKILTSDQVAAHEDKSELSRVFVFTIPNRIILFVELFPEIRDGLRLIFIGVEALEIVHVERSKPKPKD